MHQLAPRMRYHGERECRKVVARPRIYAPTRIGSIFQSVAARVLSHSRRQNPPTYLTWLDFTLPRTIAERTFPCIATFIYRATFTRLSLSLSLRPVYRLPRKTTRCTTIMGFDAVGVASLACVYFPPVVVMVVLVVVVLSREIRVLTHFFLTRNSYYSIALKYSVCNPGGWLYIGASTVSCTVSVHVRRNRDLCVYSHCQCTHVHVDVDIDVRGSVCWWRRRIHSSHPPTYLNG